MVDVAEYIKRAAQRCGYKRESYVEKNMPTETSNVLAIPFYGDMKSTFLLSSLILKTFKELHKDKYIILCSWPGMSGLFPYVDEFWSIEDESVTKLLAVETNNFYNETNLAAELTKRLSEVLTVMTSRDLKKYYDNGFTQQYWSEFGEIKRFLPEIPSSNKIATNFKNQMESKIGKKVIVYPSIKRRTKQDGKTVHMHVVKEFWIALIERLLEEGYVPVIYQNCFTYDMSRDFVDRCIYLVPKNISDVLAAFRYVDCVIDVHNGISKLAIAARCPYLSVVERSIFINDKEYEIDDICGDGIPRQYIYAFSTMLIAGSPSEWKISLLDNIIVRLKEFVPTLSGINLPSTNESYETVSCDRIRQRKAKRLGVAFINSSKRK